MRRLRWNSSLNVETHNCKTFISQRQKNRRGSENLNLRKQKLALAESNQISPKGLPPFMNLSNTSSGIKVQPGPSKTTDLCSHLHLSLEFEAGSKEGISGIGLGLPRI